MRTLSASHVTSLQTILCNLLFILLPLHAYCDTKVLQGLILFLSVLILPYTLSLLACVLFDSSPACLTPSLPPCAVAGVRDRGHNTTQLFSSPDLGHPPPPSPAPSPAPTPPYAKCKQGD